MCVCVCVCVFVCVCVCADGVCVCVLMECVCFLVSPLHLTCSTTRICGNDCVTNGVSVKKGTYIFIPICDVQCDPELWEDPDQFNPERWVM